MKTLLITLNAKYIHTSLALRWLYVVNREKFHLNFREYTIKENIHSIASDIIKDKYDIVGISVSIWNVKQTEILVHKLKALNPELIIILGGPEVSYEPAYFIDHWQVDYVVSGEGEFVLGELLQAIQENRENIRIDAVSSKHYISKHIAQASIDELIKYPSPYQLEEDITERKNRLSYFESSRGCPYHCQYCLSSLEKGVRYFPQAYIAENLSYLLASDVKQIKFLDRTFNLNKKHTYFIYDFLIQHHRENLSIQFEIYADLMDDAMITYLSESVPENYFRFEIGIQSTHEPTNIAIKRRQNFELLSHNIKALMAIEKIDLHVDLIAGLPYENFERFKKSFNDVFALKAKEFQLGFLKLLRGTNLRKNAELYGLIYEKEAPYEIIANNDISREELNQIRDAEFIVDKYWNTGRFQLSMHYLFNNEYDNRYFDFFDEFGQFYKYQDFPKFAYQLEDLFRFLNQFLLSKDIQIFEILREDYYSNFNRRPHGFWQDELGKAKRKKLLYLIGQDKDFLEKHQLNRKTIEKQTAIDPINENKFLLTVFLENNREQLEYEFIEEY
ncbi:MAG: DUF4080 domain-containing protein [Candidatus Kapaibacterium sp.]